MDKTTRQALLITGIACVLIIALAVKLEPEETGPTPIKTAAEAQQFSNDLLGFECTGENMRFTTTIQEDATKNEYGYYGNPGWRVLEGEEKIVTFISFAECLDTNNQQEQKTIYQLMFNPNNHWILQQTCDYINYPDQCPKDENGDYIWIGVRDTLNDPDTETYQTIQATRR
jgi:hypothetical protein